MVNIIDSVVGVVDGIKNGIQETFFFFEKFIHNIELSILSITFILLSVLFFVTLIGLFAFPGYVIKKVEENKEGFAKFFNHLKGNKKSMIEKVK